MPFTRARRELPAWNSCSIAPMPQQIVLDELLVGFFVTAARGGEHALVQTTGSAFSEDGTKLSKWLDAFASPILRKLNPPLAPYAVDHLVALVRQDKSATVYVNEVKFVGQVRTKGAVTKGDPVLVDKVADFGQVWMESIEVPPDLGVIIVLSSGWRRAIFFDLGPLAGHSRDVDLATTLGALWGYLAFEDRVRVSDEQWTRLTAQGWFPFVGLKLGQLERLLGHVSSGWQADELLPEIAQDLRARSDELLHHAQKVQAAGSHLATLKAALRHYSAGDALSAAGLLYPRIEGMLRDHAKLLPGTPNFSQKGLAKAAATDPANTRLPGSLLLPDRFKEYLETVYFAPFDPANVDAASRNSVSHGVVPEAQLNEKAATIALLVFEQLLFLCGCAVDADEPSQAESTIHEDS